MNACMHVSCTVLPEVESCMITKDYYHQLERVNAALPASQAQLAAASERADAQLAEVKRLEIRFELF